MEDLLEGRVVERLRSGDLHRRMGVPLADRGKGAAAVEVEGDPAHGLEVRGDLLRIVTGARAVGAGDEDVQRALRVEELLALGVAQEQDRLGVLDLAGLDHGEGAREGKLEDFDLLLLVVEAAPLADLRFTRVLRGEEVEDLRHRPRRRVGFADLDHAAEPEAGLLLGLAAGAILRSILVQKTRADLDHHPVRVAVDVGGHPELPGEHHRAGRAVVEQDRRPVAAVVGFAGLGLPGPVLALVVEGHLPKGVPVGRKDLVLGDLDARGHEAKLSRARRPAVNPRYRVSWSLSRSACAAGVRPRSRKPRGSSWATTRSTPLCAPSHSGSMSRRSLTP